MICRTHDVVAVPFPFSDKLAARRRPALVLSSEEFHTEQGHVTLAMITSTIRTWPSDVPLADWHKAGLDVPCSVRFKLFTLDQRLVLRRIGGLSERDAQSVRRELGHALAEAQPQPQETP